MSQSPPKVEKHVLKSLLANAQDSIGSRTWQRYYASVDGTEQDVIEHGDKACAWFISSLLVMHGLITAAHRTVDATIADMEKTGWIRQDSPRPGAIVLYTPLEFDDGSIQAHLGIYISKDRVISNSLKAQTPQSHDWQYRDSTPRAITAIYTHPDLR